MKSKPVKQNTDLARAAILLIAAFGQEGKISMKRSYSLFVLGLITALIFSSAAFSSQEESLAAAVENDNLQEAVKALKNNANPNTISQEEEVPVLMLAIYNGNIEIVKALVQYGADLNMSISIEGRDVTALMMADLQGAQGIFAYLLENGAKAISSRQQELINSIEEQRRDRTMADMRAIGTALDMYKEDNQNYPQVKNAQKLFELLESTGYYVGMVRDAWGVDYMYMPDGKTDYRVISYGSDRSKGDSGRQYASDIVLSNGSFIAF